MQQLDEAHLESAVATCLSRLEEVSAVMESVRPRYDLPRDFQRALYASLPE